MSLNPASRIIEPTSLSPRAVLWQPDALHLSCSSYNRAMSRPTTPVWQVKPAIRLDRENPYLLLQQVLIFVRDQDQSLRFFVDCLGFNIAFDRRNERGE